MSYDESNLTDLSKYCNTIKNTKGLPREEERELAVRIQEGDEGALNELVTANLKYVVTIAKRFAWSGIPLYDLISEGNIGLITAAKKFNPDRGTKFITYAKWWITQAVKSYVDGSGYNTEYSRMDDYIFNDTPNDDMINYEFEEEIHNIQSRSYAVNELLACLSKREYRVLQSYFGLNGEREMTLDEISKEIGLTPERVRQIKDTGIEKLQFKAMSNESYSEFVDLY